MLNKLWQYLGWKTDPVPSVDYPDKFSFTDHLTLKLEYLKEANAQEDDRLRTLESKTSLLTGQTGIIFSLLGLFIPIYLDKFTNVPGPVKYITLVVFVLSLSFYLNTILQAIRSLNIARFKYARRSPATVKLKYNSEDEFLTEEVKDLIYCIEKNTAINNYKGGCLMTAYRSFRLGNIGIGILSICILLSLAFNRPKQPAKIEMSAPVQIKKFDRLMEKMSKEPQPWLKQADADTLKVKLFNTLPKTEK
jgi:hypothetical protein